MNKPYFTRPKDGKPFPTEQYWTYNNAKAEILKQGKRFLTTKEMLFIQSHSKWDNVKKGILVTFPSVNNKNKKINVFFPASGHSLANLDTFYSVGDSGLYWSAVQPYASANSNYAVRLNFNRITTVGPYNNYNRANKYSVRCVSDTKCPGSRQAHVMINDKPVWIDLHNLKYKKI